MDIEGLGDKLVEQLVDEALISGVDDIFGLQVKDLIELERMGPKSAENLVAAIDKSKATTLPRFLYALGIREVGETGQWGPRLPFEEGTFPTSSSDGSRLKKQQKTPHHSERI